ncbi:MAG: glycosyltransferase family A protein [Devosia sp.]
MASISATDGKRKVAVLMPAWNAERYIGDAIGSLLAQRDAAKLDIIVVDDGSTDATQAVLADLARASPEVRLIATTHVGVPRARNIALDAIAPDTDFVAFLDADDLSAPGRFARALPALSGGNIDVHWAMTQSFVDGAEIGGENSSPPERGSQLGAVLCTTAALRAVGHFNAALSLAEDVDFLLRLLETSPRLELSSDVAVLYRLHASNTTRDTASKRRYLTKAYLAAAHRRRHGAPAIPAGLFQPGER